MVAGAALLAAVALLTAAVLGGCFGSDPEQPPSQSESDPTTPAARSVTVACEGIETRAGWRRKASDVGEFGLLALDLSTARANRNGDYVAKMGAVVAGHVPVTLRVPEFERDRVRLAYGGVGGGTPLSEAPLALTFMPCPSLDRSGYVGGLLLDSISEPVTLEVQVPGSQVEILTIPAAPA